MTKTPKHKCALSSCPTANQQIKLTNDTPHSLGLTKVTFINSR